MIEIVYVPETAYMYETETMERKCMLFLGAFSLFYLLNTIDSQGMRGNIRRLKNKLSQFVYCRSRDCSMAFILNHINRSWIFTSLHIQWRKKIFKRRFGNSGSNFVFLKLKICLLFPCVAKKMLHSKGVWYFIKLYRHRRHYFGIYRLNLFLIF